MRTFLFLLLITSSLPAQDRKIDPTWLHRYVPDLREQAGPIASSTCHFKPIFGGGDAESGLLRTVTRFAELRLDDHGSCLSELYDRDEEIYFVLQGRATLHYGDEKYEMRANDFTYLPPRVKHLIENSSEKELQLLLMSFRVPSSVAIEAPTNHPKIVNLDTIKEETVEGHPTSVQYKLLAGPRAGKRDAIDEAYIVTSFFWMEFAPGGTNFPHHHETAEEIYLVLDGEGVMVAGSGTDGVEGRYPARSGDAYYFRPNCTVGFYNQNKPGAKAHILAVRARIPLPKEED